MRIIHCFLICLGFLFFLSGCDSVEDEDNVLLPDGSSSESENVPFTSAQTVASTNIEVSFNQNLLPILTDRCAYSGCHDANGPDDLDFRTYQTFIRSAEDEDVFVPGNARSSDIIEEIVSGRMPPDGPPLTAVQIQRFRDWINQQDPADFPNLRYDDDDDDDHD
ncbi:hypothetical protein F4009_14215 [Candidatus Poribacteria bacterium]|nr:hypothetical protein [Candidatus Poribacteria bacterium]MYK95129.1 hypothetical protein [Candidatus Poribacteria bacterium]